MQIQEEYQEAVKEFVRRARGKYDDLKAENPFIKNVMKEGVKIA